MLIKSGISALHSNCSPVASDTLQQQRFANGWTVKLFVDFPDDIRFIRQMERDVRERGRSLESVIQQYLKVVRPMHQEFVESSKHHADVIVPVGGDNLIAIDMVRTKIKSVLEE